MRSGQAKLGEKVADIVPPDPMGELGSDDIVLSEAIESAKPSD